MCLQLQMQPGGLGSSSRMPMGFGKSLAIAAQAVTLRA